MFSSSIYIDIPCTYLEPAVLLLTATLSYMTSQHFEERLHLDEGQSLVHLAFLITLDRLLRAVSLIFQYKWRFEMLSQIKQFEFGFKLQVGRVNRAGPGVKLKEALVPVG